MCGHEIDHAFETFARSLLSEDTDVRSLAIREPGASLCLFELGIGHSSVNTDDALALVDMTLDEKQLRSFTVNSRV